MGNSGEDYFTYDDPLKHASIISKPGAAQADLSGFNDMILNSPDRMTRNNRMISRQQSLNKQPSFGQAAPFGGRHAYGR